MSILLDLFHAIRGSAEPPVAEAPGLPNDGVQKFVVRQGYALHQVQGVPVGRCSHVFGDVPSLARWLVRHADPSRTHVLVDTDQISAGVDPRDPAADVVTMPWVTHPKLAPWLDAAEHELNIVGLHALFREQRKSIVGFSEQLLAAVAQCTLIEDGKAEVTLDHRTGSVIMAGASKSTNLQGAVPTEITIRTPRWIGAGDVEYDQPVLLRWRKAPSGGVLFRLVLPDMAEVDQLALASAAELLRRQLPERWDVGVGTYKVSDAKVPLNSPHAYWAHVDRGGTCSTPPPPPDDPPPAEAVDARELSSLED